MSIQVNKIEPQKAEVFDPEGNSLGLLTELEFNDLRLQIIKNNVRGYYVKFNNKDIRIDQYGTLEDYPHGLLDMYGNQLLEIVHEQMKSRKESAKNE